MPTQVQGRRAILTLDKHAGLMYNWTEGTLYTWWVETTPRQSL